MKTKELFNGELNLPIFETEQEVRDYFDGESLGFTFAAEDTYTFKTIIPDTNMGIPVEFYIEFFKTDSDSFFKYETVNGFLKGNQIFTVIASFNGNQNCELYLKKFIST